jgi:hypothetical protein
VRRSVTWVTGSGHVRQTQVAITCSTGSTSDTAKFEPKLVSVAQPTAALRTSAGNTSPTISHATGPKDTCTTHRLVAVRKEFALHHGFFLPSASTVAACVCH